MFDESEPLQQDFCNPGEACLWYSWQKSKSSKSFIRQCFSTSILLGSIDAPLETGPYCEPQDISDNSLSEITACLCDSDFCNSYRGPTEKKSRSLKQVQGVRQQVATVNQLSNTTKLSTTNRNNIPMKAAARKTFHPDQPGLQCYSCGSLLNPNKKCDTFNKADPEQVQTCLQDEACLMYSWKKSATEIGKQQHFYINLTKPFSSHLTRMLPNPGPAWFYPEPSYSITRL